MISRFHSLLLRSGRPIKPRSRSRSRSRQTLEPIEPATGWQRQTLQASIDLFDESIVVTRYGTEAVTRRFVEAADLVAILSPHADDRVRWCDAGPGAVRFGMDGLGRRRVLLVRPARRTTLAVEMVERTVRLTVDLPNLLVEMSAAAGGGWSKVNRIYAFAGRAERLDAKTALHAAPLPNSEETGRVCQGSVDMTPVGHLHAAEAFEAGWFGSAFTDHYLDAPLSEAAKTQTRGRRGYRNTIDMLRRHKGRIPMRLLKRCGTFGEIYGGEQ